MAASNTQIDRARRLLCALTCAALAIGPAATGANETGDPLVLGLYEPYLPFASPLKRVDFVRALAESLSRSTGLRIRGEAYSKATDLRRDAESGKVQLALLNSQFFSEERQDFDWDPRLTAVLRGRTSRPFAIFVGVGIDAKHLSDLRGHRLAVVTAGRKDRRFIMNALLWGELRHEAFFADFVQVPDVAGALGALAFDRADAALLPDLDYRHVGKTGRGVRRLVSAARAACPVLAVSSKVPESVARRLSPDSIERSLWGQVGLDGLAVVDPKSLAALHRALTTDPSHFNLAESMLAPPDAPDERQVLDAIRRTGAFIRPDPLSLLSEEDDRQ